jgi:hypothetical protein
VNHRPSIVFVLVVVAALAGMPSAPSAEALDRAADPAFRAAFFGRLVDFGSLLPRRTTQPVRIWIERLTTDEEAAHLSDLAKTRGVDAIERALEEDSVGRLQIGDRLSFPIAFARRFATGEGDQHYLLIAQRPISFREVFGHSRTRDYPYTVVELDVDADGRGSGEVLSLARLRLEKNGEIELENFDFVAARLMRVEPLGD